MNYGRRLRIPLSLPKPGTYDCTWIIDGQEARGTVELLGGRFVGGDAEFTVAGSGPGYPNSTPRDRIIGYIKELRREVALERLRIDCFPDNQTQIESSFGLVGDSLGADGVAASRFSEIRFQVTGLEILSGFEPFTEIEYPIWSERADGGQVWSARAEKLMSRKWTADRVDAELYYSWVAPSPNHYGFEVKTAPWLSITVPSPGLTAEEWLDTWCRDVRTLTSAATGRDETLTYVYFPTEHWVGTVLYGRAITQEPFYARPTRRMTPCYTLGTDGEQPLLKVLQKIAEGREAGDPLIADYSPAAMDVGQHPRSRFLQLIQWIEAAHGFDTQEQWDARLEAYKEKRSNLFDALSRLRDGEHLSSEMAKFAKDELPPKPRTLLDTALSTVLSRHPNLDTVNQLEKNPLVIAEMEQGESTVFGALRRIRNGISHGRASYDAAELHRAAKILGYLLRAEYLNRLGCDYDPKALTKPYAT